MLFSKPNQHPRRSARLALLQHSSAHERDSRVAVSLLSEKNQLLSEVEQGHPEMKKADGCEMGRYKDEKMTEYEFKTEEYSTDASSDSQDKFEFELDADPTNSTILNAEGQDVYMIPDAVVSNVKPVIRKSSLS